MKTIPTILIACLMAACLPGAALAQTEKPPVLNARELAPAELLAGPGITVDHVVPTDGFYGIFTVRGEYGSVQARGLAMLRIRVAETQALARLEEVSRREAVVGGARESAQQTIYAAGQTLRDPEGTVERLPESVGGLFSRLGGKIEKRVESATGSGENSAPVEREGFANARRKLAEQLGVDPYTDNPLLTHKLDEVARWQRMGAIALGVASSGAGAWAGIATKTANLVWSQPPKEVRAANEKRLAALLPNAGAGEIRNFLDNPAFTPTTQTLFVDKLESLPVPKGRTNLLRLAGEMETRDQVRFLIAATGLLADYHHRVALLTSVESRDRLPVGFTSKGSLILPVPVDCLAWTDGFMKFRDRVDLRAARREMLISGNATNRARKELSARGWKLNEKFH
jgi:hypothetical protein